MESVIGITPESVIGITGMRTVALFRYGLIADVLRLPPGSRDAAPCTPRPTPSPGRGAPASPRDDAPAPAGSRRCTRRPAPTAAGPGACPPRSPSCSLRSRPSSPRARSKPSSPSPANAASTTPSPPRPCTGCSRARACSTNAPVSPSPPTGALRLPRRRGAVDERCDARAEGQRRAPAPKDLPHRVHRRRHPRPPLRAFAYAENTTAFLPVFKQAIARRGLPARLYVDNGANFRSQPRARVRQARHRAHPRPTLPDERFFRTLRAAWLRHLTEATASLDTLGLGRGRVPPIAPSRTRRAYPARPRSPGTTCATPTPASTSTTCSCSRPNAA